jgi:hypothetical protein
MRHPLKSLLAAIVLLLLGSMFLAPVTFPRKKMTIGAAGERLLREKTAAEIRNDRIRELRINWPAYACFTGAAVSFGWTVVLIAWGTVAIVRSKMRQHPNHESID